MKKKTKNILVISTIIIIAGILFYFLISQTILDLTLDADCSINELSLACNIVQSSIPTANGYIIKMHTPDLSYYPSFLDSFMKQDSSLNNLLSKNSLIESRSYRMVLNTEDLNSKYDNTFSGCKANDCNGAVSGSDEDCPLYTNIHNNDAWDLSILDKGWQDWASGRLKGLCDAQGGIIVTSGSWYWGSTYMNPRYVQCTNIVSQCGGKVYKTPFSILYNPKYASTTNGQTIIVPANYRFSIPWDYMANLLNNYTCSYIVTASKQGYPDKSANLKGYTLINENREMFCIIDKNAPASFYLDDSYYLNNKDFTINLTTKYVHNICIENNSCASNTCSTNTCKDDCGNTYNGLKDCSCIANNTKASSICSSKTFINNCGDTIQGTKDCKKIDVIPWIIGIIGLIIIILTILVIKKLK